MKPIQDAIESLQTKSLCPRLHIDVTHADAVCPDFVRDKWGQQLVVDLDPSYPLDLAFTQVGVEADLSFGGHVARCTFPWAAIYVVADRSTGRGQVFASNVPASLRDKFGLPREPALDPNLTKVRDDTNAKKVSRRRKRRRADSASEPVHPPQAIGLVGEANEADEASADEPEGEAATAAQTRRSAFKVIDGGG
jgi:stringent starvation protein B